MIVPNEGGMNVMSVSLLRLQNGEIALFYLLKNSEQDCRPVMRLSRDEGTTWSAPTMCITDEVGYYVLNNDRVIQLKGGRLVAPVCLHWPLGASKADWQGVLMCYLSDDNGKTWRRSKTVQKGYDTTGKRITTQEPGVVELKDGRVMMFIRASGGCQYLAWSSDGGDVECADRFGNQISRFACFDQAVALDRRFAAGLERSCRHSEQSEKQARAAEHGDF